MVGVSKIQTQVLGLQDEAVLALEAKVGLVFITATSQTASTIANAAPSSPAAHGLCTGFTTAGQSFDFVYAEPTEPSASRQLATVSAAVCQENAPVSD